MRTKVIDQRRREGYFPYYKLQTWAAHIGAWRDVQRRFKTPEAALEHGATAHKGLGLRVMTVTRTGRYLYGTD